MTREQTSEEKKMTREQMIADIQEVAERLGRQPSVTEFRRERRISWRRIGTIFGTWRQALLEAGMEPGNQGPRLPLEELAKDWMGLVRNLGRIPRETEYSLLSRFSTGPLYSRFGGWRNIPAGMLEFMLKEGLTEEWKDVFEIVSAHNERRMLAKLNSSPAELNSTPGVRADRPIYGPPTFDGPMAHLPTNEAGVVFLFATMARDLGFRVMRIQSEFPDVEVMREVGPDQWQWQQGEFEYESRNYLKHGHPLKGCDLIICWAHNWPGCPLEVVELKKEIAKIDDWRRWPEMPKPPTPLKRSGTE